MHAHIEVLIRAKSKRRARRTLVRLVEPAAYDWWLVGGRFRTSHDPNIADDDLLEEIPGTFGYVVTRGKRGPDTVGAFMLEHPSDLLRLDDPRAQAFLREGRCCALWWQKRTRLATPFEQRYASGDEFRTARPLDLAPAALFVRIRADSKTWWLATVDMHW